MKWKNMDWIGWEQTGLVFGPQFELEPLPTLMPPTDESSEESDEILFASALRVAEELELLFDAPSALVGDRQLSGDDFLILS